MEYARAFLNAVGRWWFSLPAFLSGVLTLADRMREAGLTFIPEMSVAGIGLVATSPLILWTVGALLIRVVKLERELRPSLDFGEIIEQREPHNYRDLNRRPTRLFKLAVENIGGEKLADCLVKITSLVDSSGIQIADVPIALQTENQHKQNKRGPFKLRVGEAKNVLVCSYNEQNRPQLIDVYYEHIIEHLSIDDDYFIEITAYGSQVPIIRRYKMCVDAGQLRFSSTD